MGHPKDIFKNRGPLTDQEIQDYLSGKLSKQQQREIELKMSQDGFNMDAMTGFQGSESGFAGFEKVQREIRANIKKQGRKWQFHHTLILSGILVLGTMFLGPFLFPDHGEKNSMLVEDIVTSEETAEPVETQNQVLVEELSDEEIEKAVLLDELDIVQPNVVITSSPIMIDSAIQNDPSNLDIAFKEIVEIKKVAANTDLTNIEVPTKDDIVYSNVPLIYMKNFLLVDYSKIYVNPPTLEEITLSGTSAALENKDDELNEMYETNVYYDTITYQDFLRETQEQFGQNKFKGALKRYKTILKKYPNDLNAHFYSGLCYFNIGKYEKAIEHFMIAKNHPYNTFQLDAEWYMARTYCQQGKSALCHELLQQIVVDKQYYHKQAQELLDKVK